MDYEGNYFPQEEEKQKSKFAKNAGKALRFVLFGIVAVVYAAVMIVLLSNCEPKMYKEAVFSPTANRLYEADPEGFDVYELFPTTFMNYDGSVQIAGAMYSSTAKELELGLKYNSKLKTEDEAFPQFVLVDTDGKEYSSVCNAYEKKGRYCYARISFCDVTFKLDENKYINPEASAATEGEGEMFETFNYTLKIYVEGQKEPETILIFDNATPIQLIEYVK